MEFPGISLWERKGLKPEAAGGDLQGLCRIWSWDKDVDHTLGTA